MEAPKKLYIDSRERWLRSWTAFMTKAKGDDIEYIRKDVVDNMLKTTEDHVYFAGSEAMREKMMGKAVEWLEDNIYEYIIDNSHCGGRGAFLINPKLFKDLKQAMSDNIKDK